jgi:hypothetical protein
MANTDENVKKNTEGHRWQPGESGNPHGKPKGARSWASVMRELFEEGKITQKDIILVYIQQAKDGNIKAAEGLADRMDGKAKEQLLMTIDDTETKQKLKEIFDNADDSAENS